MSEKITKIIEEIKTMSLIEVNDLVKSLEEEFGVSAAAPVMMAATAEATVEKTEFNVKLSDIGAEKIKVIKVIREITGLGLAEAKKLVESAPVSVKENISKDESETIKKKLEEVGAKVEIN